MNKEHYNRLSVLGCDISLQKVNNEDFLSLTDIARYKNPKEPKDVVANRLRLYNTIQYLGLWEKLHNTNFKGVEFDAFKMNQTAIQQMNSLVGQRISFDMIH